MYPHRWGYKLKLNVYFNPKNEHPMIFPIQRHTNLEAWIPETDVDGVDIKDSLLADVCNIDFNDTFIKNAVAPRPINLPFNVKGYIATGYKIIACKYFEHSTKGNYFFFILYRFNSNVHSLKFILWDMEKEIELYLTQGNGEVVIKEAPKDINYNLINDQLRINLNCTAHYTDLNKDVILNLSLVYLPAVQYAEELFHHEGWYLFPRWLGWTYTSDSMVKQSGSNKEDFEDGAYILGFALNADTSINATDGRAGSKCLELGTYTTGYDYVEALSDYFTLNHPKSVTFYAKVPGGGANIRLETLDGTTVKRYDLKELKKDGDWTQYEVIIDIPSDGVKIRLVSEGVWQVGDYLAEPPIPDSYSIYPVLIDDMSFEDIGYETAIIAKYFDGQRALINIGIFQADSFSVPSKAVDWRVTTYEIYIKSDGLYYLRNELKVDKDTAWKLSNNNLNVPVPNSELQVNTLNFNYGLGETVRVDTQSIILKEVVYKNRTYFVKGDARVYQSHLSGSGKVQPDSFPYDESVGFGYFELSRNEIGKAIAVTPLDELVVLSDKKTTVYSIQGSLGTVYRKLKAVNGSRGIYNTESLTSDLSGSPTGDVHFWFDVNGIYAYGGGINPPVDITIKTFKNYWKKVADKNKAICFFNYIKDEYWIAINNTIFIFDMVNKGFKKYQYDFNIEQYIGIMDNKVYLLGNNTVYVIDQESEIRLSGYIETHYSTNTMQYNRYPIPSPEHEQKLLQELFVAFNKPEAGIAIMTVIIDGASLDPQITFNTGLNTDLALSPLSVRYGKLKLHLEIPSTRAELRELGYSFKELDRGIGSMQNQSTGLGQNSGTNSGVGL